MGRNGGESHRTDLTRRARALLLALVLLGAIIILIPTRARSGATAGTLTAELDPPFTYYYADDFGDEGVTASFEYQWIVILPGSGFPSPPQLECTGPNGFEVRPDDPRESRW